MPGPRVLIDLRWMIPGRSGGLEVAAFSFLGRLLARPEVETGAMALTIIVPWELIDQFNAVAPPSVALLSRDSLGSDALRVVHALTGRRQRGWLDERNFDIAYTMNGRISADISDIPTVVLISDLQHLIFPEFFEKRDLTLRKAASADVARRARHILTISEFSRQEIVRLLGVDPSRVSRSYLAADPGFERRPPVSEQDDVLSRYNISEQRYLLIPAQIWPHKNHMAVINALYKLARSGRDLPMLVSTGRADSPFAQELMARVAASEFAPHFRFLGFCPQDDLAGLYRGAEAVVFCSLYEGFGMPILEAMRMGCPVIASNTTSIPEVSGDAALLVDPTDSDAIADVIIRLQDEPGLRERLVAAGRARAEAFCWDRHCDEVVARLYEACGSAPPSKPRERRVVNLRGGRVASTLGVRFRTITYPRWRRRLLVRLRRSGD